jgi:hypothetical protein
MGSVGSWISTLGSNGFILGEFSDVAKVVIIYKKI